MGCGEATACARGAAPRTLPLGNPGTRDPETTLHAQGVDLSGTVKTPRLIEVLERGNPGLGRAMDEGAVRLRRRLDRAFPPGDVRGLLGAMLLGERGSLSPHAMRALRDSGTVHVLSVSGLHVAVLLAACLLPLRGTGPGSCAWEWRLLRSPSSSAWSARRRRWRGPSWRPHWR